jgi:spore germination protein YaaH
MIFKKIIVISFLITGILLSSVGILIYNHLLQPTTHLSPEGRILSATANENHHPYTPKRKTYIVLGFLPYWLLNQANHIQYESLTQIAYFGIEFDQNAQLKTKESDGSRELGLHRLRTSDILNHILNQTQNPHLQNILVVKILNNPGIEAAISPKNKQQIITTILQFITDYPFTGINIDFEYIHTPPPEVKKNFTQFIKELHHQLNTYSLSPKPYTLSIDVYADTGIKQSERLWQLQDLEPYLDHFIVMGYDFHRPSSPQAGPIAPIHGAPDLWEDDLVTSLRAITQLIHPQKIILGIPFYGYEWDTYAEQPNSTTIKGTGRLATYARVQNILTECGILPLNKGGLGEIATNTNNPTCFHDFDSEALSPYLIYLQGEYPNQIWYENTQSLKYKLQLIKSADLGGIAVWALGYESPYLELWEIIDSELVQN